MLKLITFVNNKINLCTSNIFNVKLTKNDIYIFFVSFFIGIITHFQILSNNLYMTDYLDFNVTRINDELFYGAGTISGRWFIELLNVLMKNLGYTIKIPSFGVFMAIVILSLTNILLLKLIKIDNNILQILIIIATMVSPSLVNANYFTFTTHMFALSILLIVFSIYNIIKNDYIIVSTICMTLAIGIYQAYISYILALYIVCFFQYSLKNNFNNTIYKLIKCMFSFIFSLIYYYLLILIFNNIFGNVNFIEFPQYGSLNAINVFNKINIFDILSSVAICYTNFFNLFTNNIIFAYNNTTYASILNLILFIIAISTFIFIIIKYILNKKINIQILIFNILLVLLLPIATNFIFIMTLNNMPLTQSRVAYSYIFYIIFSFAIFNEFIKNFKFSLNLQKIFYSTIIIVSSLILFDKFIVANNSYYNFKLINDNAKIYSQIYATRLMETDGFNEKSKIIMIGKPQEKVYYYLKNAVPIFYEMTEKDSILYHSNNVGKVMNFFANTNFNYIDTEYSSYLSFSRIARNMPIYPEKGSIKKYENYILVKFEEIR